MVFDVVSAEDRAHKAIMKTHNLFYFVTWVLCAGNRVIWLALKSIAPLYTTELNKELWFMPSPAPVEFAKMSMAFNRSVFVLTVSI